MTTSTGGEAVVATLEALGVTHVFGIVSVHNIPIIDAVGRLDQLTYHRVDPALSDWLALGNPLNPDRKPLNRDQIGQSQLTRDRAKPLDDFFVQRNPVRAPL